MVKFGKESAAPDEGAGRESGKGWLQNHGALVVCIIAVLALLLRTVFVYGVSAASGFALSGGSEAQYHLHVVESILNGSFVFGADAAVNYPIGGLNLNPPLYDFLAAAVGAVSGPSVALSILAPIFGVLTIFPVYLIGKELRGTTVGIVAALFYGLMALPISSSVLSNGTEYAFTAFLVAIFTLIMIKVVRKVNQNELAMKEVIIAGLFLGLIALTWNGFRSLLVVLILIMVIQLVIDRFNSKDFKVPLYTYSIILIIGVAIGAAYYIPAGLWDAVFSGPVLITVIAVALGFIFWALRNSPWIFVVPGLTAVFIVIAAVLFFVQPALFNALIFGNSMFANPLMQDMSAIGVSISKMSSYYGWLLMWMPLMLGLYEFYVYARKDRSHTRLAYTMWLLIPWIFSWSSYGAAVVMGSVYAVASAIVVVKIITKADLKTWWANMRSAGFPGFFRKMIKPLPFLSVIIAIALIVVPGCIYAVDAGISENETYNYFSYGNTVYVVAEGDTYPYSYIYEDLEYLNDNGAVVTWIEPSSGVAAVGYSTVNDSIGTGASAVAHMYLSDGAAGSTASMVVRMMMANHDVNLRSAFGAHGDVYDAVYGYIDDPETARQIVQENNSDYGYINSDVTDENAVYFLSVKTITDEMSTVAIMQTYGNISSAVGEEIRYFVVDGSMLPIMYGDGDSLAAMAYFAGYSTDIYGAAPQFYNLVTYYSNYYPALAEQALYDTFLWKSLIGPAPEDLGYSSSFGLLYDLTASDGTVEPMPGSGLAGYEIVSWHVKYNEDSKADGTDENWIYMDYEDAIALQQKQGGAINYMSSIILYEYTGVGTLGAQTISGDIVNEAGLPLEGITVEVTNFNTVYDSTNVFSETKTDSKGHYDALVPTVGDYMVIYKSGTVKLESKVVSGKVVIESANFDAYIKSGEVTDYRDYLYTLEKDGKTVYIDSSNGHVKSADAVDVDGNSTYIVPGVYTYKLIDSTAAAVANGTVTLYAGSNTSLIVSPTTYTITATVKDITGQNLDTGCLVATNATTGYEYTAYVEDGKAVVTVPTGTYNLSMIGGYVTLYTSSLNVTSNRTVSLTAYESSEIQMSGTDTSNVVYGGGYSEAGAHFVTVPVSIGSTVYNYSVYGNDGTKVYYGLISEAGKEISLTSGNIANVHGTIGMSGTVTFIYNDKIMITATAANDGSYSIDLMPGDYTVWASNGSNKAFVSTLKVNGETTYDMTLVDGKKITGTYQYASGTSKGNVALPFAATLLSFTDGSSQWALPGVTGTDGTVVYVIPTTATGIEFAVNGGRISNSSFEASGLSTLVADGTTSATATVTIPADSVVKQSIKSDYTMVLTPYSEGSEITVTAGQTVSLSPGQYDAEINASSGYYFSGTVYVYPGKAEFVGLDVSEVFGTKIDKRELDVLEITGEGTYGEYNDDGVYYFEYNCKYFLTTTNPSTGYMKNGFIFAIDSSLAPSSIDMSTDAAVRNVTGYVGAVASGTVSISYGDVLLEAEVDNGEFKFQVPSDVGTVSLYAEVTKTVGSQTYGFTGLVDSADVSSGTVNVPVASAAGVVDYTDGDLNARIDQAVFSNGSANVKVTVFNNTDTTKGYSIVAGSAWTLNQSAQLTIEAHGSKTVDLSGVYDPQATGIASSGMTLVVKDFNGSTSKTLRIIDGDNQSTGTVITMKTADTCDNKDKLSGSEYQYALTFVNSGATDTVTIDVTVAEAGYTVMLMSEDGALIKSSGSSFYVPAQSTTVIYAKVMKETGEMDKAPGITVRATAVDGDKSLTSSSITIGVDSMTVSGDSVVDQKSGVPMGVWFILGLCIILLILIVWMGSKRGVFSRK